MLAKLYAITCTGADSNTAIPDLIRLAIQYPLVEFGLLLSKERGGSPRYPSKEWFSHLIAAVNRIAAKPRFSVHICGVYARDLVYGRPKVIEDFKGLLNICQRIQINVPPSIYQRSLVMSKVFNDIGNTHAIIFQVPDFEKNREAEVINEEETAALQLLYDKSYGTGQLPSEKWPASPANLTVGYAGGLTFENLPLEYPKIAEAAEGHFWIDMETGLRNQFDEFDLDKVQRILELDIFKQR